MSETFIINRMKEHESEVTSLALTPDGTYLFASSNDGHLSGYWVRSYAFCMGSGKFHHEGLTCLASSPDSEYLAGGSTDHKVILWKHKVVGHIQFIGEHLGPVTAILFSPDGKYIYSAGGIEDNTVIKWNIEDKENCKLELTFPRLEEPIRAMKISNNGGTLIIASGKELIIRECSDGTLIERKIAHEDYINDIKISSDLTYIITGSEDKSVKLWSSATLSQVEVFVDPDDAVTAVAISRDSKYIAGGTKTLNSEGNLIYIWEIESGKLIQVLKGHSGGINSLEFTFSGDALLSGSSDNSIIAWDFKRIIEEEVKKRAEEEARLIAEMEKREQEEKLKIEELKRKEQEEEKRSLEEERKLIEENEAMIDEEKQKLLLEMSKEFQAVGELIANQKYEDALALSQKIYKKVIDKKLEVFITPANNLIGSIQLLLNNLDTTNIDTGVSNISKLEISKDKMNYDKKEKRLSIDILDFTFLGQYYPSSLLAEILDHFYAALSHVSYDRGNIIVVDPISNSPIPENTKVKDLNLLPKLKEKKEEVEELPIPKPPIHIEAPIDYPIPETIEEESEMMMLDEAPKEMAKEYRRMEFQAPSSPPKMMAEPAMKREKVSKPKLSKAKKKMDIRAAPMPSAAMGPPPSPPGGPTAGAAMRRDISPVASSMQFEEEEIEGAEEKIHDINMGLQYYAVMMEKQTYLFYVYLSHKELVIQDEEGKTVYETTFQIVTTTPEPPKLDLRIEGEGFEVHPIRCIMQVDEDAISQPVMIFSITALPRTELSEKERKKGYRRFLNIIIEFEEKKVSHTVMSVIIQTKHISMKLGPVQLNLSKAQAMAVCLLSISITAASSIYTLLTMDFSSTGSSGGNLEGIIPGAGSLVFMLSFIMTILKKGVFPIKKKVAGMLDFTQAAAMMK